MKKICFVAEYMYCGGSEKSLLSLLNCIDRKKYQITILLMGLKGALLPKIPQDVTVKTIPLPKSEEEDLLNGRGTAIKNALKKGRIFTALSKAVRGVRMALATKSSTEKRFWYYQNIKKKVAEYPEEFDVVIDYFGYGLFNTLYAARKVRAKKKISWIHFEPNFAMPDIATIQPILNEYDQIMCVSEEIKRQAQHLMPELNEKLKVFHNIVDVQDVFRQAKENPITQEEGYMHILSVGRLDAPKGFDLALKPIERLVTEGYLIRWHIVGEGPQRRKLEDIIANSAALTKTVVLHGQQLNPYPYIDACDIYFQPSRHEGYGIAVAEARAFCKPIIVTDFAGAKEQLINEKTGLITQCDEQSLYLALKRLLDDETLRIRFSKALIEEIGKDVAQVQELENIFDNA